jgi:AraC family transcriptional regulator
MPAPGAFGKSKPGHRPGSEVTGVDIDWRRRTRLVGLTRWRCLERATGVTEERRQLWRVIAFVHDGAYEVRGSRGRALVDSLHVAFFRPGEPYTTSHPCGVGDHGSALVMREDLFAEILRARFPEAAEDPRRLPPAGPCPTPAIWRHRRLLRAVESGGGGGAGTEDALVDDLAVDEASIAVADALLAAAAARRHEEPVAARSRHRDLAEGAKELLGREFRRPQRLETIATRLHVTPAHLCRVFRKITGWSIHRYLTDLRLRAALEPLAAGEPDLSGLAFDLGFSSHSHFTSAFRSAFGVPPSTCRGARPTPAQARF